jgi:hypothetical protein
MNDACTEAVPLLGHFVSPILEIGACDKYGNHPAVNTNKKALEN